MIRFALRVWTLAGVLACAAPGCTRNPDAGAERPRASHAAHDAASPVPSTGSTAPAIRRANPPGPAPRGMVWLPGGEFWMGCEGCGMPDALPVHLVSVDGFWMDRTPVTNAAFAAFVSATHYVTVAERRPDPADFPGVPKDKLVPGSVVFTPPGGPVPLDDYSRWWRYVPDANWRGSEMIYRAAGVRASVSRSAAKRSGSAQLPS
jgi:formylglycine-generating enzyme